MEWNRYHLNQQELEVQQVMIVNREEGVYPSYYPCADFMRSAGILEDVQTLISRAGLSDFVEGEPRQYVKLTMSFVQDFKFNWSRSNPTVQYKIYNKAVNLPFSAFCAAIRVLQWGSCEKIKGSPQELSDLYKMICDGRSFSGESGKITSIQLPAIRYFAYFITKCVLAKKIGGKLSIPDLAFLAAALQNSRSYNLGALIAYRLATNREKGGICGGLIASRLLAFHNVEPHHFDIPFPIEKLDIASMIKHEFVSDSSSLGNLYYRMIFYKKVWRITKKTEKLVRLPAPVLSNLDSRGDWSVTEGALDAHIERGGHHARDDIEVEEHLDSSSDAASSSHQHGGYAEPPRFSSAQELYYDYSMDYPPARNNDPRWG